MGPQWSLVELARDKRPRRHLVGSQAAVSGRNGKRPRHHPVGQWSLVNMARDTDAIRWDHRQWSLAELARDSQRYLVGPWWPLTKMADKRQKEKQEQILDSECLWSGFRLDIGDCDCEMYQRTLWLGLAGARRIRGGYCHE